MKSNSKKIGVTLLRKNFWSMLKVYNSELAKEYRTRKGKMITVAIFVVCGLITLTHKQRPA